MSGMDVVRGYIDLRQHIIDVSNAGDSNVLTQGDTIDITHAVPADDWMPPAPLDHGWHYLTSQKTVMRAHLDRNPGTPDFIDVEHKYSAAEGASTVSNADCTEFDSYTDLQARLPGVAGGQPHHVLEVTSRQFARVTSGSSFYEPPTRIYDFESGDLLGTRDHLGAFHPPPPGQ